MIIMAGSVRDKKLLDNVQIRTSVEWAGYKIIYRSQSRPSSRNIETKQGKSGNSFSNTNSQKNGTQHTLDACFCRVSGETYTELKIRDSLMEMNIYCRPFLNSPRMACFMQRSIVELGFWREDSRRSVAKKVFVGLCVFLSKCVCLGGGVCSGIYITLIYWTKCHFYWAFIPQLNMSNRIWTRNWCDVARNAPNTMISHNKYHVCFAVLAAFRTPFNLKPPRPSNTEIRPDPQSVGTWYRSA